MLLSKEALGALFLAHSLLFYSSASPVEALGVSDLFAPMNDMPREPKQPAHSFRTEPYPIMPADLAPQSSSRSFAQDFASQASERASTAWSNEDDARLMQFRAQGMNWGPISSHFPSKTANACRKRHERLMEKKSVENWDGIKIEDLARAYLECRETMWKIMANHLGEKWQTVEMKVRLCSGSYSIRRLTQSSVWRKVSKPYRQLVELLVGIVRDRAAQITRCGLPQNSMSPSWDFSIHHL